MIKIEAEKITKKFGKNTVFKDLSLTFEAGVTGISGRNGSGKSTLLKCLANLLQPTGGRVNWHMNGKKISSDQLRSHLGFVAPYVNLYSELSARENLDFIVQLRGLNRNEPGFSDWLDILSVTPLLDIPFGKLSTGQQQRVKLASALIYEPGFLFLDEPGTNLDEQGHGIVEMIAQRWKSTDRLLIIASNQSREHVLCDTTVSVE